ncbi:MAG TPA: hypothetical protein VGR65_09395 [Casimicrobiaceae bacterium]|nr:hypothetical protein [Casimicrobiaceae bacterium]
MIEGSRRVLDEPDVVAEFHAEVSEPFDKEGMYAAHAVKGPRFALF